MIRILVIDDHKMFLQGIGNILDQEEDMHIVALCESGEASYDLLKNNSVDLVLLDIQLQTMSGLDICKYIRKEYPKTKVLMLSMLKEESFITQAMSIGAHGYILKSSGQEELLKAIRIIQSGQTYFSSEVTQVVMNSLRFDSDSSKNKKQAPKISKREKEVLQLIVQEHTTQEIANLLFISLKTVESHRSNLLAKMGVRNIAGLVRKALEFNLVE